MYCYFCAAIFLAFFAAIQGGTTPDYLVPVHCSDTEELAGCGNLCEDTCENVLLTNRPCPAICYPPACTCKLGFVRNKNGTCVNIMECPRDGFKCPENERENGCGPVCERKCGEPSNQAPANQPCPIRPMICSPPQCVCKDNYARRNNRCVPSDSC